ncbi:arsenic resistance protein [Candidatus Contubernalis alkaliaceticus]|uniref:arsenic resistance protein n=1 Tax=Candidatus Contubernalis alkaliaceticus TaxID=338645 RepID=UPI001F4BE36F|nr:arsenic resistance protein [Candidatus Contubernalis alkalaceticus]
MIVAIFIGLGLGQVNSITALASFFIVPFLMVILFGTFLQITFASLKEGFMNIKAAGLSLAINFLWTPLLAFGLAYLFLRDAPDIYTALIMDMVTPCTDWYLVFTSIAGGNLALSTALLPWNLLLQLVLLPVYLLIFAGTVVEIQPLFFLQSFFRVLIIPFMLAVLSRKVILSLKGEQWYQEKVLNYIGTLQATFLILAITAMFASQGTVLIENSDILLRLLIPVTLFFIINFLVGQAVSRIFKLTYQEGASLIFTTLARNAPLAITIAAAVFPERPLISLVLAVESLIELPILFVISQIMLFILRKQWWPEPEITKDSF